MKRTFTVVCCLIVALSACVALVACGNTGGGETPDTGNTRDDSAWFSQQELEARGLANLPAPNGLTGDMHTTIEWFGNGYFFSQPCPSKDVFEENAKTYFDYFTTNFDGRFGKTSIKMMGVDNDETWYYIEQKANLSDYFSTNPSARYTLYFVTDNTLGDDGYIVKGSTFTFDVRYEFDSNANAYLFKMIIESADTSRNGVYTNHYVMK